MIKLKEITNTQLPKIPDGMRIHDTGRNNKKEITKLRSTKNQESSFKPIGFWYGIGGDWFEWCLSEMPNWIGGILYEVVIPNSKNIFRIENSTQLKEFTLKYYDKNERILGKDILRTYDIDWKKVASDYDGIEISPYIYQMRMEIGWYYSWDVASGCIWNTNAVKLKKIGENLKLYKGIE